MKDKSGGSPCQFFLGVSEDADDRALLGLAGGAITVDMIEFALRQRLMAVYRHPQGRSPEADLVKNKLRNAALVLRRHVTTREQIQQSASAGAQDAALRVREPLRRMKESQSSVPNQPQLTEFDRSVMAILISSGGWNNASRGRLIALASANRVPVEALGKIVTGLGQYARSGSGLMAQTLQDSRRVDPLLLGQGASPYANRKVEPSGFLARVLDITLKTFSPTDTGSLVRFIALFALIVIFIGILLMQWVIKADDKQQAELRYKEPQPAITSVDETNQNTRAIDVAPSRWLATFVQRPTLGAWLSPPAAAEAADKASIFESNLGDLAKELGRGPKDRSQVLTLWSKTLDQVSRGWLLMDRRSQYRLRNAVTEVLVAASGDPKMVSQLIGRIAPSQKRMSTPLDLWSGAWRAGMLGEISGSDVIAPSIVQDAQSQLSVSLYGFPPSVSLSFENTARWWLDSQITALCDGTEFLEDGLDRWDAYLRAHDGVVLGSASGTKHGSLQQLSIVQALRTLMSSNTDLGRSGPSQDVMGRLLEELDLSSSLEAKQGLLSLFENESVTSNDLWVLTSLLSTFDYAPWFLQELVLAPDATAEQRNQVRLAIEKAWPDLAIGISPRWNLLGQQAPIDKVVTEQWLAYTQQLMRQPELMRHEDLVRQAWAFAWLNQAATAIAANRESEAQLGLQRVTQYAQQPLSPVIAPTVATGVLDDTWASKFRRAREEVEERLYLLGLLRAAPETIDVGQEGAQLLAKAAYLARPEEVRDEVQSLLVSRYQSDYSIAMALLDELPDAPRSTSTSVFIQNYTLHILPASHSDLWESEVRFSLLRHILMMRRPENSQIDKAAEELAKAYVAQARLVGPRNTILNTNNPGEAIQMLVQRWDDKIAGVSLPPNSEDNRADLVRWDAARRALAQGPIQALVADQIRVLEVLAFLVKTEHPASHDRVGTLLAKTLVKRGGNEHVLHQLVEVERAIAALWRIRLTAWLQSMEEEADG